jgi:hypothetical protein
MLNMLNLNDPTTTLRQHLEELKKAVSEKNKSSINQITSNIIGQSNLLTSRLLAITTEHMSLEETLFVLEQKKDMIFLLVECFAYVLASKRNTLGEHIQILTANIYDCANEGVHYLAKNAVFTKYSRIILLINAHLANIAIQDVSISEDVPQFFLAWMHGVSAPIRKAAKHYFRDECGVINGHPVSDVTFAAKVGGVQIGTRAIVSFADAQPTMTFHVKAHQNYAAMTSAVRSSQRKGIDLKELFVYKVLEYIGVCPKVHFITHQSSEDRAFDKNALFIATQDAAYTKTPKINSADVSGKIKLFQPIGELYQFENGHIIGHAAFLAQFNTELSHANIGPLKIEATVLDIIARVFRLGDFNEDNLARISITTAERSYEKWKLFDFTVPENMEGRYIIADEESTTEGFIRGNGTLRHPAVFFQDALMGRERSEKIEIGNAVINVLEQGRPGISHPEKRKMSLPDAVNRAFDDIVQYMAYQINDTTRARILGVKLDKALLDLHDYQRSALQNFEHLKDGLRSRQAEWVLRLNNVI